MPKLSHGLSRKNNPTYYCWKNMRSRIKNNADYSLRGLTICKRWDKFENFLADMGECPKGYQIDREDNNKGYSKSNCRWVDKITQMRNTRLTLMVTYNNEKRPLLELCELFKIKQRTVKARLQRGWRLEDALKGELKKSRHDQLKLKDPHQERINKLETTLKFVLDWHNQNSSLGRVQVLQHDVYLAVKGALA